MKIDVQILLNEKELKLLSEGKEIERFAGDFNLKIKNFEHKW